MPTQYLCYYPIQLADFHVVSVHHQGLGYLRCTALHVAPTTQQMDQALPADLTIQPVSLTYPPT